MRIAVTGTSGLIGRAVVDLALAEGHEVVGIDRVAPPEGAARPGVTAVTLDMAGYAEVLGALRGCDALVHLAAIPTPSHNPDHEVHNNNVVGSYNALRAAAETGIRRVCQASSVNAIGASYSRRPRYDYFPLDEQHPTYNEDPYSLSKWICEQQGDSIARRYEDMHIASLRFSWVTPRPYLAAGDNTAVIQARVRDLWGLTLLDAAARACLLALTADFGGHEVFYIVAPHTVVDTPSLALKERFFPDVPLRGDLPGRSGFFNCEKATRLLGWRHDE